jgi:hypothetical protein
VTRTTFADARWRDSTDGAGAGAMFAVFHVVRQLREMLWYLASAARAASAPALRTDNEAL